MKRNIPLILTGLLIIASLFFWRESLISFLANHTYYQTMLSTWQNRGLFISALIIAVIPIIYLLKTSNFTLKKRLILLLSAITLFWLFHSIIKGWLIGFWRIVTMFHTALLVCIWAYTITWCFALWSIIEKKLIKFTQHRRQELFLTFGIWLCAFLAVIRFFTWIGWFIGSWMLLTIISWLIFIGFWVLIYYQRKIISQYGELLTHILTSIKTFSANKKLPIIIIWTLLTISTMFLLFWYQNSFIPYSTARDANHEYMYIPKILANNGWVLRWNTVGGGMPYMRHMRITFFFSLTQATNWILWISPDNMWVSLNFVSALLILLFSIWIVFQLTNYLRSNDSKSSIIPTTFWRWTLLLRLTSWMWAFLVMVDNKTDLWIMALSSLAILSWLIFLWITKEKNNETSSTESSKYLILAWIFFAFACLAKPTAFVDILLFAIFLISLRISPLSGLWVGLAATWCLRFMNILTSSVMINTHQAKILIIIWAVITIVGLILSFLKKKREIKIWLSIKYLLTLMITFLITLILFKTPRQLIQQLYTDTVSPSSLAKWLLVQVEPSTTNADITLPNLWEQSLIDSQAVQLYTSQLDNQQSADACLAQWNIYSKDELNKDLIDFKEENNWGSDLWRYIWYWRNEFSSKNKAWWTNPVYYLAKIIFPSSNTCYWFDQAAKLLCSTSSAVDNFEINKLKDIYSQLKNPQSRGGLLLEQAINAFNENTGDTSASFNPLEYRDHIVALRQFYQSYAIKSSDDYLAIPYRYLVPLNISFNWSLQNLSSYYTDIGFHRIITFILLIIILPYAIIKRQKNLIAISLTTLIWRGVWRVIGSAILWYWTVLISRTMLSLIAFGVCISQKENKKLNILTNTFLVIIAIIGLIQIFLNFFRISSQWASWPFVRYKASIWNENIINDDLTSKSKTIYWYWAKNVFDLQFPQYNSVIDALANRADTDWVIIEWTYIQYFLQNQRNINNLWIRKTLSDGDLCKSYRRFKNWNTKYIILDPNVWTVWMWEWNESLFHRFFAKLDPVSGIIDTDWEITDLVKLYQKWYLNLIYTNNIGAYYAFNATDAEISQYFWATTPDEITLKRAKIAVMRYFSDEVNTLFSQLWTLFINKITSVDLSAFEAIAGIYGLQIDASKVRTATQEVKQQKTDTFKTLTQSERQVAIQWLNLQSTLSSSNNETKAQWQSMLSQLLTNWISSSSQLMAFELK